MFDSYSILRGLFDSQLFACCQLSFYDLFSFIFRTTFPCSSQQEDQFTELLFSNLWLVLDIWWVLEKLFSPRHYETPPITWSVFHQSHPNSNFKTMSVPFDDICTFLLYTRWYRGNQLVVTQHIGLHIFQPLHNICTTWSITYIG